MSAALEDRPVSVWALRWRCLARDRAAVLGLAEAMETEADALAEIEARLGKLVRRA